MNTITEAQQRTLANMLPGKIFWRDNGLGGLFWHKQPEYPTRKGLVIDTELLQLCWEVEETLTTAQEIEIVDWGYYPG